MDLVITVDTSVAHLAGALGKPVWILVPKVPDFRWMMDSSETIWYDSARLYRQPVEGDWQTVFKQISSDLPLFLNGSTQQSAFEDPREFTPKARLIYWSSKGSRIINPVIWMQPNYITNEHWWQRKPM
jgi:hypothetical protein